MSRTAEIVSRRLNLLLLANKGYNANEIAFRLGCAGVAVHRHLKKLRSAGYKIYISKREGLVLNQNINIANIQNAINLLQSF